MAEFREANRSLVLLAQRDLTEFFNALNLSGDPLVVRNALLEFFPELVTAYGDAAAILGADWYDVNRKVPASVASFRAVMANPAPVVQAHAVARWAVGPLFQTAPDPVQVLKNLNGATQRLVLQPGRDTIWQSAAGDPVRTGVARVPSGPNTCGFCVSLASRGAVYKDEAAAGDGNRFHNDCDCVPTVIRSGDDFPDGYDVDLYRRLAQEASGIGRDIH